MMESGLDDFDSGSVQATIARTAIKSILISEAVLPDEIGQENAGAFENAD
jgi:hypothetical protein